MHVSVSAVADDSQASDVTDPAAEGVCSIGILMYVPFVNVFTAVDTSRIVLNSPGDCFGSTDALYRVWFHCIGLQLWRNSGKGFKRKRAHLA